MNSVEDLSNPSNYKILIQIKKSRKLKRKAKYLNNEFDFVEDIRTAKFFPTIQSAEETLEQVSRFSTNESRPRIIIKYLEKVNATT